MTSCVELPPVGFCITGLLSPEECQDVIAQGEHHLPEPASSSREYRDMDRSIFESDELAARCWERIKHHFADRVTPTYTIKDGRFLVNEANARFFGRSFHLDGEWRATGLNPLWRFGRYATGGHFSPHRDGFYAPTVDIRSLFTFMVYLNANFIGGATAFLPDPVCGVTEPITVPIAAGTAVIFPPNFWHEGGTVLSGTKYILRSDVLCLNSRQPTGDEARAHEMVRHAVDLELEDPDGAVRLYRQAFRLCPDIERYC